jgi:N6-adenosine-specific RNA methylase IME4
VKQYEPHPIANLFPMLDGIEMSELVADIKARGLIHPITIHDGKILDGRNRYAACLEAGVSPRFETLPDGVNPWLRVWSLNVKRRHLPPDRRVAFGFDFLRGSEEWQASQEAAKERTAAKKKGNQNAAKKKTTVVSVPPSFSKPEPKTRDKVAAFCGVSPSTAQKVMTVAAKSPAAFEKIKDGTVSANKAIAEIKLEAKTELAAKLDAAPVATPKGPFDVIACDPPWKYDNRVEDHTHRGRLQYPEMTVDAICKLNVADLAADNCVLWLWTTNAFMRQAFAVVDAWGFQEKTILTWAKDRMGLGDWLRGQTEHCILAVRGKPIVTLTNQTTLLRGPVREHSRKPDEFFEMVDVLCHGAKLEMFSREARSGWQAWGAEQEKF